MREWDAETYHRVSNPQLEWGRAVLDRLPLRGDELVIDVGCGTGRLTSLLMDRLPRGSVLGIDVSLNMLRLAYEQLHTRRRGKIHFALANAAALPIVERADAVFSTATFHWVLDHHKLFLSLHRALKPGGRLVAQCGGGPNLARLHHRAAALMRRAPFAAYFENWIEPWEFASAELTAQRLAESGFEDVRTSIAASPVVQPDAGAYRVFITNIICRPHLGYLPDSALRAKFVESLVQLASTDDPPFDLDYWRLNIDARRPASRFIHQANNGWQ